MIAALNNSNANVGGREIEIGQQSINIRGLGLIDAGGETDVVKGYRTDDIENIVLTQSSGTPVLVRDVARVSVGHLPRLGVAGKDRDDDIVAAIVVMGRAEHTNEILPKVEAEIEKINADGTLPPGVRVAPYYDRSTLVNITTSTVLHNLAFGCLLVFLIQWIFLGDLRSAIIVGANIPFALFFAVMILVALGQDGNLLSVGAIDFGIIVDSAVILVENVFRIFQSKRDDQNELLYRLTSGFFGPNPTSPTIGSGTSVRWSRRLRLVYVSAMQVDKAVFFTATITVVAFLPLFTMTGVEGQIFGPMARTYAYALTGALLSTFTVTPVLASLILPRKVQEIETIVVRTLRRLYVPALRFVLAHARATIVAGALFLAFSGVLATRLGTEFLPALEEGNFWIRASMPPTLTLDAGEAAARKMREILLRHPEVRTVVSQHGRPDNGSDASPLSNVELFAPLHPVDQWARGQTKAKLTAELQKELIEELPGIDFNFSQYIQDNVEEALSGVKGANSVKVIGPDLAVIETIAARIMAEMREVRGVSDLGIFRVLGQPNLNIKIDRARAARYGVNASDLNTIVQAAIGGTVATTILEGDRQFSLIVRLQKEDRDSVDAIRNIRVGLSAQGGPSVYVPLSELADITLDTGAAFIYRERSLRYVPIKFSVRGRDLGSTVKEAQERISAIRLPQGYRLQWSGEFDNLQAAQQRLMIVVPVTILLILVLLYSVFNSVRDSLVAAAGIPFSIAGGIISLYVSGIDFSISAAIGFISLFGVAVMDGILNITYFRELVTHGMDFDEAIEHGTEQRMRPMLMTALSAGIGLLPAALSHGIGSQVQRPLATVVVGGMTIGPLLLLLVAPALRKTFLKSYRHARPGVRPDSAQDQT